MKTIIAVVLQLLFLGMAYASLELLPYVTDRYMPVVELFPLGLGSLLVLFGLRFNRSQLVYAAALLVVIYAYFFWYADGLTVVQHRLAVNGMGVLLPLNLAMISLYSERGLLTPVGMLRVLFLFSQILGLAWLVHVSHPLLTQLVLQPLFPQLQMKLMMLNQMAIMALLVSGGIIIATQPRRNKPFRSGLFSVMLLVFYTLALPAPELEQVALLISFALLLLLLMLLRESYRMAFVDELTGLPGRRALNEALHKLGSRYTIAMLDVDHFKKFNDRYGHDAGDDVLSLLGSRLREVKGGGKPFRYGGEEFTIVFSGCGAEDANPHLEALRESVAGKKFSLRKKERRARRGKSGKRTSPSRNVSVTISIGVAERSGTLASPAAVLKAADKALYRAKKKGRNRVSK